MLLQRLTGLFVLSFLVIGVFPSLLSTYGAPQSQSFSTSDANAFDPIQDQNMILISINQENPSFARSIRNGMTSSFPNLFPGIVEPGQLSLYVQTGTFSSSQNAQLQASGISDLGVNIEIIQSQDNFKVWVGPYQTREDADEAALFLSSYGYSVYLQEAM
jgi:hypothetical protein